MAEIKEEKYMFQLVTPNKEKYDRLVELQKEYPELTYDNTGYDTISKEVKDSHKKQIEEIHDILKSSLKRYSSFQNFKPRKDGNWCIRLQYSYDGGGFTGVGYFYVRHWNPEEHGKH